MIRYRISKLVDQEEDPKSELPTLYWKGKKDRFYRAGDFKYGSKAGWTKDPDVAKLYRRYEDALKTAKSLDATVETLAGRLHLRKSEYCGTVVNEFNPDWTVPPGDIIKDWLEEQKRNAYWLANAMNISMFDCESLLNGTLEITFEIAVKLFETTGRPVDFWLNLERLYRSDLVEGKTVA